MSGGRELDRRIQRFTVCVTRLRKNKSTRSRAVKRARKHAHTRTQPRPCRQKPATDATPPNPSTTTRRRRRLQRGRQTSSGIRRYLIVFPRMYTSAIFQNWSPSCNAAGMRGRARGESWSLPVTKQHVHVHLSSARKSQNPLHHATSPQKEESQYHQLRWNESGVWWRHNVDAANTHNRSPRPCTHTHLPRTSLVAQPTQKEPNKIQEFLWVNSVS